MFKVNNKNNKTTSLTPFSSVSIVEFELVSVSWGVIVILILLQFNLEAMKGEILC